MAFAAPRPAAGCGGRRWEGEPAAPAGVEPCNGPGLEMTVAGAGLRLERPARRPAARNAPGTPTSLALGRAGERGAAQVSLSERRRMRPASAPAPAQQVGDELWNCDKGFINDYRGFRQRNHRPGNLHAGRWESRGRFGAAEADSTPSRCQADRRAVKERGGDNFGKAEGQEELEKEVNHPTVAPDLHANRWQGRATPLRSEEFRYNKFMSSGRHAGRWEERAAFGDQGRNVEGGDGAEGETWEPLRERPVTPTTADRKRAVLLQAGSGFHNKRASLAKAYEGACEVDEAHTDCFGVACGRGLGTRRAALEFLVDRRSRRVAAHFACRGQDFGRG